jgi:hypothetical protein
VLSAARIACGLAALLAAATAHADEPITDRDWALDLYQGAALGTVRIVGMGGASVAVGEGSAGSLTNPAAAAVRRTTSIRHWDWDWHADALSAVFGSDFDNNGRAGEDFGVRLATAGITGMAGRWSLALSVIGQTADLEGSERELTASASQLKIALARAGDLDELTWGVGYRIGTFALSPAEGGESLFELVGTGLEAGAVWRPPVESWRVGGTVSLPISGTRVDAEDCDPLDCEGYILPGRVEVPWHASIGVAFRQGPTPWNQKMPPPFRDEEAVLIAADLVVTGSVDDGHGLEAFSQKTLQPSGRSIVVSARVGAEWEYVPGRLRLRGGAYWEPGRFEGVGGRPHLTMGIEGGFLDFRFFGPRRLRVSLTGDIARRYGNAGISLGFWH